MLAADRILVQLLAELDAAFWPCRDPSARSWRRFAVARAVCRASGVAWTATAAADHERRAERDALAGLVEGDLVLRASSPGDRVIRLRLTDAGESRARALVGLPSLPEAFAAMRRLARLQRQSQDAVVDPGLTVERWWVRETTLAGIDYCGLTGAARQREAVRQRLNCVAELCLSMISRGWIEANSDSEGHVAYRVTDRGLSALARKPKFPASDATYSHELNEHYIATHRRAMERIAATDDPSGRGEIGQIPMPGSMLTRREWRRWQADPKGMLAKVKEQSSAAAVGRAVK